MRKLAIIADLPNNLFIFLMESERKHVPQMFSIWPLTGKGIPRKPRPLDAWLFEAAKDSKNDPEFYN